jgi:hypothetical protein
LLIQSWYGMMLIVGHGILLVGKMLYALSLPSEGLPALFFSLVQVLLA